MGTPYYHLSNDEIVKKYQHLKCYSCGNVNKGKMTICKSDIEPKRNDAF